jgi:hypothetical protein
VKGDENLFTSESRLPLYFPLGFGITLIYTLAMLMTLNKSGRPGAGSEGKSPVINFAEGRTSQFILCGNDRIKDECKIQSYSTINSVFNRPLIPIESATNSGGKPSTFFACIGMCGRNIRNKRTDQIGMLTDLSYLKVLKMALELAILRYKFIRRRHLKCQQRGDFLCAK